MNSQKSCGHTRSNKHILKHKLQSNPRSIRILFCIKKLSKVQRLAYLITGAMIIMSTAAMEAMLNMLPLHLIVRVVLTGASLKLCNQEGSFIAGHATVIDKVLKHIPLPTFLWLKFQTGESWIWKRYRLWNIQNGSPGSQANRQLRTLANRISSRPACFNLKI